MRAVARTPPDPAPYAAAEAAFAEAKAYLCSREAQQMSESDLERELQRRGQELMRKLLQGHLDQRSPGEAAGPVAGADGVERSQRRVHERRIETTFGTVAVERVGYARPGHDSLHPLDAALNLPPERYSLEVRRRVAEAAASRSFDEALFDLSRSTRGRSAQASGGTVGGSRGRGLRRLLRGAPCTAGPAAPRGVGCRAHLRRQGRGAASRRPARGDAAGGRAAPAAPGAALPVQAPEAGREEARQAHGDGGRRLHDRAVRAESGGVPAELDATTAGGQAPGRAAPPGGQTGLGEPRTRALGGGCRGDAGSRAPGPRACQALGRARRRRRDAARPGRSERRRLRGGRDGDTRHHPRGRVRLEGGARVPSREEPRAGVLGLDARTEHSRGQGPSGGRGDAAVRRPSPACRATPASRSIRAPTTC